MHRVSWGRLAIRDVHTHQLSVLNRGKVVNEYVDPRRVRTERCSVEVVRVASWGCITSDDAWRYLSVGGREFKAGTAACAKDGKSLAHSWNWNSSSRGGAENESQRVENETWAEGRSGQCQVPQAFLACQQYHYVKNSFINSESFILFIISMTGIYEHWNIRWRARESEGND